MDEKVMNQLDGELAHAGEATTLSPKMLLLEKLRITPEKELNRWSSCSGCSVSRVSPGENWWR
jgi:hypothetical protein